MGDVGPEPTSAERGRGQRRVPIEVKKPAVKSPLILKPRRIYLNQPVKIFDRQILVNLSALNDGVAVS